MINKVEYARIFFFLFTMQHASYALSECDQSSPVSHCNASKKVCDLVDKYVINDKRWDRSEYILKQKGLRHGDVVIWVLHCDDLRRLSSSGGKSFVLHVDSEKNMITDELIFQ